MQRAWHAAKPDAYRKAHYDRSLAHKAENRDKVLASKKAWKERNPAKVRRSDGLSRAPSVKAQPQWASVVAIEAIYERAILLTSVTGVPHEVDHIIPLKGKNVCGLHVPENLRAIPARENKKKGSAFSV